MNCQEARKLVEDAVDNNVAGSVRRRLDLHLMRCRSCREFFAAEKREHAEWFDLLNDPSRPTAKPPADFVSRLVAQARAAERPWYRRFPRWGRVAAIVLVCVGLSSYAAWTAGIIGSKAERAENALESLASEGSLGSLEAEGSLGAEGTLRSVESEWSLGSVADSIDSNPDPIVPNDSTETVPSPLSATGAGTLSSNTEKEETMNLKSITKATAKLAVGAALTTGLAANADEEAGWTYSNGVLTEKVDSGTAWEFNVAVANDFDLTLNSVKTPGDNMVLDLNKPIEGGYGIRSIAKSASLFQSRAADWVNEIVLPKTLTSIAGWAFENCKNTITIPEDNEIVTLNDGCFSGSYLTGRVVLPKLTTMKGSGNGNQGPLNACTRLYELDLGPDFHQSASWGNLATGCSGLTNFTARGVPFTIEGYSMSGCSNLRMWTFYTYPTLGAYWIGGRSFGKTDRLFIKVEDSSWQEMLKSANFTPWANEKCDRETYFANFGEDAPEPLGYTTKPFSAYVLAISEERGDGAKVLVDGSSDKIGVPDPDYGEYADITDATTFTVPQYAANGAILYESTGYALATFIDMAWVPDGETVPSRSWTFTPVADEYKRITWNWGEAGYQVNVEGVSPGCSVTTSDWTTVEGFVVAGSTVTLTANGEGFSRWYGVPDGVDATQRTISVVVTEPLTLSPYYARDWQYDATAKTIDDGYWTISVSANGSNLTLSSIKKAASASMVLDLNKPVSDGARIVSVTASGSLFQDRAAGFSKEIILPKTLTSIAGWAFSSCSSAITIPEDNEIVTLGGACFYMSALTGRVVLPKLTTMNGNGNQGPFHGCTKLRELDLGPDFHQSSSWGNLASGCSGLTDFTARGDPFKIQGYSMSGCAKMNTWTFNAYPTLETYWISDVTFGKKHRLFINKSNPDWKAMLKSDAFTPWASEKCDKATYFANFGDNAEIPLGYTTKPFAAYVLKTSIFAKSGMMLIFY